MISPVLYFQLHQPRRLRRVSVFDQDARYFDEATNIQICRKVADKCYRPATRLLTQLCIEHRGRFRCGLSITGSLLRQLEEVAPDIIPLLQELVATGYCELLGETSHHSLASLYSPAEFAYQVGEHSRMIRSIFGVTPRVFRNTELIYSSDIARAVAGLQTPSGQPCFAGMLTEGAPQLLGKLSPGNIYAQSGLPGLPLLARHRELSDDIAFRFSNRQWDSWPLTPQKYATWIAKAAAQASGLVNIFMDFETLGEHQWAQTGIFDFVRALPAALFEHEPTAAFITPSMALGQGRPAAVLDCPEIISWADAAHDISAWRGNAMQVHALDELYSLGTVLRSLAGEAHSGDTEGSNDINSSAAAGLLATWRDLTTSDHVYYMSTKGSADGVVHGYFRPFDSPYESYISFMNTLTRLRAIARELTSRDAAAVGPHGTQGEHVPSAS